MKFEELAEQMHIWYLEATLKLHPESFNPNAQKKYEDLTDEQKFIDIFIAKKVEEKFIEKKRVREALKELLALEPMWTNNIKEIMEELGL